MSDGDYLEVTFDGFGTAADGYSVSLENVGGAVLDGPDVYTPGMSLQYEATSSTPVVIKMSRSTTAPPRMSAYINISCSAALPVSLASIVAIADGGIIKLIWDTDSESGSQGFEVQHQNEDGRYETLGFVDGAGTTIDRQSYEYTIQDLDYGSHTFRLKLIDLDGSYAYSDQVEVLIEVPDAVATESAYPNPFNPTTTLRFAVSSEQMVRAALYDIQGRIVKELGDIQATPHEMQSIQIDGTGLSSGTYLVRLEGEHFAATERITMVK